MIAPLPFVLDSNVLISAVLSTEGRARAPVNRVRDLGVLLFSNPTWVELDTRIRRAKFDRWITREERLEFFDALLDIAEWTEIAGETLGCRDPADDKFLETAEKGSAVAIVTGDADLLTLHPWRAIPILSPAEFLTYRFELDA